MDFDKIQQYNQAQQDNQEKQQLLDTITEVGSAVSEKIEQTDKTTKKVIGDFAKPSDISRVVDAVKGLEGVLKPKEFKPLEDALKQISKDLAKLPTQYPKFPDLPKIPEQKTDIKVTNLTELKGYFEDVIAAVGKLQTSIKFDPMIEVKPADVTVNEKEVDLAPITKGLTSLEKAFKGIKTPEFDTREIIAGLNRVSKTVSSLSFPVPNYVLPFKDINGAASQGYLDADGNLKTTSGSGGGLTDAELRATAVPVSGTVAVTGVATAANQTSQITLQTQLESLIDTLQELVQRLSPLAGAMNSTAQLRVVATGTVTASGPITSAQSIAEKAVAGISYTQRVAIENNTAIQSNINNAVA